MSTIFRLPQFTVGAGDPSVVPAGFSGDWVELTAGGRRGEHWLLGVDVGAIGTQLANKYTAGFAPEAAAHRAARRRVRARLDPGYALPTSLARSESRAPIELLLRLSSSPEKRNS